MAAYLAHMLDNIGIFSVGGVFGMVIMFLMLRLRGNSGNSNTRDLKSDLSQTNKKIIVFPLPTDPASKKPHSER